jgi:hypothetical protein
MTADKISQQIIEPLGGLNEPSAVFSSFQALRRG